MLLLVVAFATPTASVYSCQGCVLHNYRKLHLCRLPWKAPGLVKFPTGETTYGIPGPLLPLHTGLLVLETRILWLQMWTKGQNISSMA